ncbi:MAG: methyl-accepting chemotaxis protein [Betaproteobacteria bacterium]|nr:methyl-accepting chemotaxis protein [Betaproteobacteria bacterium]
MAFEPTVSDHPKEKNTLAGNTMMFMNKLNKNAQKEIAIIPFIGHLPVEKQKFLTLTTGIALFIITGLLIILSNVQSNNKDRYIATSFEMQLLLPQMNLSVLQAGTGDTDAFPRLQTDTLSFDKNLNTLIHGAFGLPPSSKAIQPQLDALQKHWQPIKTLYTQIAQNKSMLLGSYNELTNLDSQVNILQTQAQASAESIANSGSATQADQANQLVTFTQRIKNDLASLKRMINQPERTETATPLNPASESKSEQPDASALRQLNQDVQEFNTILNGLLHGNATLKTPGVSESNAYGKLMALNNNWAGFNKALATSDQHLKQILAFRHAYSIISANNELSHDTDKLTSAYEHLGLMGNIFAVIAALLGLASLIMYGAIDANESQRRIQQNEVENKRNQQAILRLLNELGDLADGDLTTNATVSEDLTGAIADSINYTIDELRTLVGGINHATEQLTYTTGKTQTISDELLTAAQLQSQEIKDTSSAIMDMTQSINEVSLSAHQSAQVASQSLEAAEKGAQAVENSITGMNSIREDIQETSKRIKRLGESSQEIGEIVELISDITEQTNVLALNAAIQAAAAGEAGRGFSVVAEEVQRLAERSGQATKQIAAIVKTIQADTQDAVSAMETSTQGVVEGARLSDAAGQALREIEQVSRSLATLIQNISSSTELQAITAGKVTHAMQSIQHITEQTTSRTQETTASVGELSILASDLKNSVAGFKLA